MEVYVWGNIYLKTSYATQFDLKLLKIASVSVRDQIKNILILQVSQKDFLETVYVYKLAHIMG